MPDWKTEAQIGDMICPRPPSELLAAQQGLESRCLDPKWGLFNRLPLCPDPPPLSPPSTGAFLLEPVLQPILPLCLPQDFDLLLIFLADENDNHPLFTESTYQAEVMENSPAGRCQTPLGTPAAARHHLGPRCLRTSLALDRGLAEAWRGKRPRHMAEHRPGRCRGCGREEGAQL